MKHTQHRRACFLRGTGMAVLGLAFCCALSAAPAVSAEDTPVLPPRAAYGNQVEGIDGFLNQWTEEYGYGYIYQAEALEACRQRAAGVSGVPDTIPLYAEDGVTVIGAFPLVQGGKEMIYGVNEHGRTYGHGVFQPDLILARGVDGTSGYVYDSVLSEIGAMDFPGDAPNPIPETVPLYAEDGVTVVGEFAVGTFNEVAEE